MIKVLGASGSLGKDKSCISFQLNENAIIDAGNVIRVLREHSFKIDQVFLTHAHFDHIIDLPFLIETYFNHRQKPLQVYALKDTIDALKNHLFNGIIWPKFHEINHPKLHTPLLSFHEIALGETIQAQDISVTPIPADHVKGACGYLIKKDNIGCVISGDSYIKPETAHLINRDTSIKCLFIDVSFPSKLKALASASKHLTPQILQSFLQQIDRSIHVYPYHLKPSFEEQIINELNQLDFAPHSINPLQEGDELRIKNGQLQRTEHSKIASEATNNQLQSLLTTAQALSSETNVNKLLELILQEAMDFSHADAGTLYQLSEDQNELVFTVVNNRSLDIQMGGTAEPITWHNLPLKLADSAPNDQMVATFCANHKQIVHIESVYDNENFNFEGTKKFDATTGYHSQSMLVLPLLNSNQELVGVLQLINKLDDHGQNIAFTEADKQNALALASQAAISLTNSLLIKDLEKLFESVIGTITKAFDEKCSFTGGHVRQVSELSQIIAHGISNDQTVYKDVHYSTDNFHEIKIAALLHDVGKIATPEFIMQKSTKLEKVYDRIETIQNRIEIAKRDAKIALLESQLSAKNPAFSQEDYENRLKQLDDDFAFLKTCNKGRAPLSNEDIAKINQIAQQHVTINDQACQIINDDELMNLLIRAGTLNQEEREKIMDHARVSLEILSTLPFPKKYKNVVHIAANHHEKLDGSGYPRGLKEADIVLEDRILILADLYEALSSQYRPYKKPNPLSQIFNILCSMANEGQIDKTLLKFFYESGTYKHYNQFLNEQQIDQIQLNLDD
ncbi:hypothetical protein JCM30760_00280 [Thiomicrorhabdus hydrogeniphila]